MPGFVSDANEFLPEARLAHACHNSRAVLPDLVKAHHRSALLACEGLISVEASCHLVLYGVSRRGTVRRSGRSDWLLAGRGLWDLSWLNLGRKSAGAVDGVEGLAEVVGERVGGGVPENIVGL